MAKYVTKRNITTTLGIPSRDPLRERRHPFACLRSKPIRVVFTLLVLIESTRLADSIPNWNKPPQRRVACSCPSTCQTIISLQINNDKYSGLRVIHISSSFGGPNHPMLLPFLESRGKIHGDCRQNDTECLKRKKLKSPQERNCLCVLFPTLSTETETRFVTEMKRVRELCVASIQSRQVFSPKGSYYSNLDGL